MAGFKNLQLNNILSLAVLDNIKLTLLVCSRAMVRESLKSSHLIDNHEEKIRNRLYENYLKNDEFISKNGLDLHGFQFTIEAPDKRISFYIDTAGYRKKSPKTLILQGFRGILSTCIDFHLLLKYN